MPTSFTRPTLPEIIDRVQSDIEGFLQGVNARLRRRVEYALARAIAGVSHGLHGHLSWVAEQILPDQASEKFLLRWGSLFDVFRKAAIRTQLTLTVTGTGGALPAGTEFIRVADGFVFTVDTTIPVVTTNSAAVTAVLGGADGNMLVGQTLTLVSPIVSVDSEATVATKVTTGVDVESLADFLERLLARIRKPVMGGAPGDHVTWALETPTVGVTRAWEYRGVNGIGNPALGKVAVTFVCDGQDEDGIDIIPDPGQVAAVQSWLNDRSPAQVDVFAPTPVPFDYEVILNPHYDGDVQDAVEAEVRDMIARDSEPGGTILLSRFNEAVSTAEGEISHTTVSPVADVDFAFGEIAVPPASPTWS